MSTDDQAMITLTGFDMLSFQNLMNMLVLINEQYTPYMNAGGYIIHKVSLTRG
jgi:hypothetical protein